MRKQTPPFFISFSTSMLPSESSIILFTSASPRPLPSVARERSPLIELIKYLRLYVRGYRRTVVPYLRRNILLVAEKLHAYLSALRGELDSVVDDILPYLRHKLLTAHIHDILKVDIKVDFFLRPLRFKHKKYFSYLLVKRKSCLFAHCFLIFKLCEPQNI